MKEIGGNSIKRGSKRKKKERKERRRE